MYIEKRKKKLLLYTKIGFIGQKVVYPQDKTDPPWISSPSYRQSQTLATDRHYYLYK